MHSLPEPPDPAPAAQAARIHDPHTHAQPDRVRVTHVELDLLLAFAERRLSGTATLDLEWRAAEAATLVLDTRELAIDSVEALDTHGRATPLAFALGPPDAALGAALVIEAAGRPARVRIAYRTGPEASGLQWLTAAQTADRQAPFLFSQSEAIHARSWVPLQDTPSVRFTYAARVEAPAGMRVLMSAPNDPAQTLEGRFRFAQPRPIPSYLLAIAAGVLDLRALGSRSAVYAEPSVLARAAAEFADTEAMLATAEDLYGPYAWGRYDLLVLPPSFPFGGMENPNLTFATPTVLVGDRSLVSLVAHELAHSWSGNLVTAATWRDIWLNEGFTTYVEGRITEAVYGKARADEEVLLAARALRKKLPTLARNARRLAPDPQGLGADEALSVVAYDKGAWFLRTLEARFGRVAFDAWLQGYFARYAFQSITTETMLAWLDAALLARHPGRMPREEVDAWIHGEDIPDGAPLPDSPRFRRIDSARAAFLDHRLDAAALDAAAWNTQEWMHFLDGLPDVPPCERMQALDAAWRLTGTPNAEIGMRWYVHAIASGCRAVWPAAGAYVRRIGRLYLCLPIYRALAATADGHAFAAGVYRDARDGYHPMTRKAVEAILAAAPAP